MFNDMLQILYIKALLLLCVVICIILHFEILNFIIQSSAHFVKVFKSSCSILWSFGSLIALYNRISSANNLISLCIFIVMSFIYIKNKIGQGHCLEEHLM